MYIVCISNCCHLHIFELRALCKLIIDKTIFFLSGFSFTDSDNSQDSRGKEGTIFYSTLPVPLVHEHWDIYLQLCLWDDCHIFSIALLVFTRLLLDEIYHLIKLPFDWLMMECQFCLLDDLILDFVEIIWHGKLVNTSSHRLSPLYYKQTHEPSVLVTPSEILF